MTVFQLAVYSCISVTSTFNGDYSKTCNWSAREMYTKEAKCNDVGMKALGEIVHEFSVVIGASPRKIETYSCNPVSIVE